MFKKPFIRTIILTSLFILAINSYAIAYRAAIRTPYEDYGPQLAGINTLVVTNPNSADEAVQSGIKNSIDALFMPTPTKIIYDFKETRDPYLKEPNVAFLIVRTTTRIEHSFLHEIKVGALSISLSKNNGRNGASAVNLLWDYTVPFVIPDDNDELAKKVEGFIHENLKILPGILNCANKYDEKLCRKETEDYRQEAWSNKNGAPIPRKVKTYDEVSKNLQKIKK